VLAALAATASGADSTTLAANAIQSASSLDGLSGLGAKAGEAASATSTDNFINFCSGQTLTNGLQITTGSCNGIVMGFLPSKSNMVSCVIVSPTPGQQIQSGTDFSVIVQTQNIQTGSFTNADATYYAAPQNLNSQGQIIGHTHITIQDLGSSINPSQPPDPQQFAFFQGVDDNGNGQGTLNVTVAGGLPSGFYRACTLSSASNHQPVIMPVAQRGSQDDCTKFQVVGSGGTTNAKANDGSAGIAAAALAQSAVDLGPGALTTGAAAAAQATSAATTTTAAAASKTTGRTGTRPPGGGRFRGSKGKQAQRKFGGFK